MSDHDPTEATRRREVVELNAAGAALAAASPEDDGRAALEAEHGKVYTLAELDAEFTITGFMAPYVGVVRKADGVVGSMQFQHRPRFYFSFVPDTK